jgi:hypothetical protein
MIFKTDFSYFGEDQFLSDGSDRCASDSFLSYLYRNNTKLPSEIYTEGKFGLSEGKRKAAFITDRFISDNGIFAHIVRMAVLRTLPHVKYYHKNSNTLYKSTNICFV